MKRSTEETARQLQSEADTMALICEQTRVPILKVFGYKIDDNNPISAAFLSMEYLPGTVVMDVGGENAGHGLIPQRRRKDFYSAIARIQA